MKKFIIRLMCFIVVPLPILFGLNYIVDTGLKKSKYIYYPEWNDLFNSRINADVLVIGSSRAWVHISPAILDSVLHVNSYNVGLDGTHFLMQYDQFRIYLQHNRKPKYILLSLDFTTFTENYDLIHYEQFLPYLDDTSIRNLTSHYKGRFKWAEYHVPLYKYNNQFPLIAEGIRSYFGISDYHAFIKYKGYEGQDKPWDFEFDKFVANNPQGSDMKIDDVSLDKFVELLQWSKNNNVKVIFVFTPMYHEALQYINNKDKILDIYSKYAAIYHIPFLNYLEDSTLVFDKNNFYNSNHMNKKASETFSNQLASDLQSIINKPSGQ